MVALTLVTLWILSGRPLYGQGQQTATATLSGTVTDPQGLRVAGANVTLKSGELGISRAYSTDGSGLYTFSFLPSAVYTLEVEASGFKHYVQKQITLAAGQSVEQKLSLTIGANNQTVEVTAEAPLLNTDNANISSDVGAKQIEDLPLNFRSVISLAELNSSVSNNVENMHLNAGGMTGVADQDISFLHFGGTHFGTAEYLLDGSWDTRDDWGGVIYVPAVDDVQEFKIQPYAFSAQYGFSAGNVINVVTKSGTSQFHGDAYMFYRNQDLDAVTTFLTRVGGSRKQYGATLGGPLQKNKTFFFVNYEGLRQAIPAGRVDQLPSDAERTGDFSALLGGVIGKDYESRSIYKGEVYNPFSTRQVACGAVDSVTGLVVNNCPTGKTTAMLRDPIDTQANLALGIQRLPAVFMDPIGLKIATYWPSPSNALAKNCTSAGLCSFTSVSPSHSDEYSVRVDHNFSDNTRAYARWSQKYEQKTNLPPLYGASDPGGPGLVNPNNRYSTSLGVNHILSSTFAVSASLGVNRHVEGGLTQGWGFKPSSLGLPAFTDTLAVMPIFPQVTVGGGYAGLGANGGNNNYITPMTLWTGTVDFTKNKAKHQFAFGFMDVWLQHNGGHYGGVGPNNALSFSNGGYGTGGPDPTSVTSRTGDGFASLLMGVGTGSANYTAFPAQAKHFLGWYFQDTWKVTSRLTLNPGLRYEIQTPYRERRNAMEHFDFLATNPLTSSTPQCTTFAPNPQGCISNYPLRGAIVYRTSNDRNLYNTNFKNFAPRVGFSFQALNKLVVRGGYGIFFEPNIYQQANNNGFSATTNWIANFDGVTPTSTLGGNGRPLCSTTTGQPRNFVSCDAAFYVGPYPGTPRQVPPTGNSLRGLQDVGLNSGGINPIRKSPYVQQWMFGLQFASSTHSVFDISYVGNRGLHNLYVGLALNNLTPAQLLQFGASDPMVSNPFFGQINGPTGYQIPGGSASACGLDKRTIRLAQLARPYPEFCGVTTNEAPVGNSTYHSLQTTFRHRWHSGLDLNVSYTFSKFLSNGEGAQGGFYANGGLELGSNNYQDVYNLRAEKSVDSADTPHSLVVNYNYELPFGRGKWIGSGWGRPMNAVLGGWSWSGIFNAKTGLPISITEGSNSNYGVTGVGGAGSNGTSQRPNVKPGVSLIPPNQSINNWINALAFVQPAQFTYGNAPRYFSNLRGPSFYNWDMAVHKTWPFAESKRVELRFEMYNALNHPNYYLPNGDLSSKNFGKILQAFPARSLQLAGKFYW